MTAGMPHVTVRESSSNTMKAYGELRSLPRRAEVPSVLPSSNPASVGQPRSSSKRKFQLPDPPPSRKPEISARSRLLRPQRRKSLSVSLQIFGDSDNVGSVTDNPLSDFKDGFSKETDSAAKEKRRSIKQGLKDSTNIEPLPAYKQSRVPPCSSNSELLALKEALRAEKEARQTLQMELDEERSAATIAANEAMAMISRLQEEKAAVLMESRQFKRMAEEREEHNLEAITLLKDMLLNKEHEILSLENELATYKDMFLELEGGAPATKLLESHFKEPVSGCYIEGVESWTDEVSITAKKISSKEDISQSTFATRRTRRNFKGLISDDVRSNLGSYFDRIGQVEEQQTTEDSSRPVFDGQTDSSTSFNMFKSSSKCSIFIGSRVRKSVCESITLQQSSSPWRKSSEVKIEPFEPTNEEQNNSLWDRISKLEHRLETFGIGEQSSPPQEPVSEVQEPGVSCDQTASPQEKQCLHTGDHKMKDDTERPKKVQCREYSQGSLMGSKQDSSTVGSSDANMSKSSLRFQLGCSRSKGNGDVVDGMHDVYEVDYQQSQRSRMSCNGSTDLQSFPFSGIFSGDQIDRSLVLVDENVSNNNCSIGRSSLPSALMAPDLERMEVDSQTPVYTAQISVTSRNPASVRSGSDIQQLTLRLQALEAERHYMHQAISGLKKENDELKLLEEISQQLNDLKRSVQSSDNRSKEAQPSSVINFVKGFLSYLPRPVTVEERSAGSLIQTNSTVAPQKDHAGLSDLLDTTSHLNTDRMMMRGLKVKVPN